MERTTADPVAELRLMVARLALGLVHSWEVRLVADRALANGVYSDALAELAALREPIMSDVVPLFERARRELGLSILSRSDAAWLLARDCMERIVSPAERPRDVLQVLKDVSQTAADVLPDHKYVGEGLDLGSLIGIYWSYTEPDENYYEPEKRLITDEGERQALLDLLARREAKAWLDRHRP